MNLKSTQGIDDVSGETEDVIVYVENGRIVVEGSTDVVRVYDVMGRMVQSFKRSSHQDIPTGVYLVKVGILPARKGVVVK